MIYCGIGARDIRIGKPYHANRKGPGGPIRSSTEPIVMKLLRIISSVDPKTGGPIEGVLQQTAILSGQGIETRIASLDDPTADFVRACPVPVQALGAGRVMPVGWRRWLPWVRYGYSPAFVPWLKAHVRDYDAVIVEGVWTYAAMAARRTLVGGDTPYAVFPHGMLDPWFRRTYPVKNAIKQLFWWACEGPLLNHARAVFFTTEEERIVSRNAFRPYRVTERVVGFGTGDIRGEAAAQQAAFRAAVPDLHKPYLLFLSRLHPKKGCDLLIESFARVAEAYPDIDLVIAGPDQIGWQRTLQEQAARLGVGPRIHWPGMLGGDVKWGAFRDAEAFILPSHQENFGIVVAEAMAAETPVLITDKINIWREVAAAKGGLVQSDTTEGIERLLRTFLSLTPDERRDMRRRARAGFLKYFEITRAARTIGAALHEVVDA